MTSIIINLDDVRLRSDERAQIIQISNNLTKRPFVRQQDQREVADPLALAAAYWGKKPDGDI